MLNYAPPPIRPRLGVKVDPGVDSGTNQKLVPTFLFYFYINLSCTVWPQYAARQTDRREKERSEKAA